MRYVAILLLAFVAFAASGDDFVWLEGEWISDADTTMVANPQLMKLDDATRSKFKRMYGRILWRFDNGTFEAIYPGEDSHPSSYSVRELEGGRSELLICGTSYGISRTETGFCVEAHFDPPESKPAEFPNVECFKMYASNKRAGG